MKGKVQSFFANFSVTLRRTCIGARTGTSATRCPWAVRVSRASVTCAVASATSVTRRRGSVTADLEWEDVTVRCV